MNGERFGVPRGMKRERIDLMVDRYIRGKYSFEDIGNIVRTRALINVPAATMHSLIGSGRGEFMIVEPGYGFRDVAENYAAVTNFPVLAGLTDFSNPFYGKDRYDRAIEVLKNSTDAFSVSDALRLLEEAKQEGKWGTKVSFAYSANENAVYYCLNGDFSHVEVHRLA